MNERQDDLLAMLAALSAQVASLQSELALQRSKIAALEQIEPVAESAAVVHRQVQHECESDVSSWTSSDADASELIEESLMPLARELAEAYDFEPTLQHPKDLEDHALLLRGARMLQQAGLGHTALLQLMRGGEHVMIGLMAAQALMLQGADVFEDVVASLPDLEERGLHFALKLVSAHARKDAVFAVLSKSSSWWAENAAIRISLRRFFEAAHAQFGPLSVGRSLPRPFWLRRAALVTLLEAISSPYTAPLLMTLQQSESGAEAKLTAATLPQPSAGGKASEDPLALLERVGRLWESQAQLELIVPHPQMTDLVEQVDALLTGPSRRSVVLMGKPGVGKTVAVHWLAERLEAKGWTLFEASAADVLAGQRFIGELEGRVGQLLEALQAPRQIIWYIPDFHELLDKGATQQDPTGILDLILPSIERHKILILGETQAEPYARLQRARHKLRYCLQSISVESTDLESSVALARDWAAALADEVGHEVVAPGVIEEAVQLSLQYFADRALPGSIMQLLQLARMHRQTASEDEREQPIDVEDLLKTIAQLTHLPASVLDDRQRLDIESLREHFRRHVIGQEEAVECLVDRIAMIKAGLTDPSRPLGVFLFAGPTGTGKTELAKTLCRFLFGTENHTIRLDMSEYNDRDSYWRLIQEGDGLQRTRSLASQIREQPFSVVLLDEVEKAHPQIWDLFLQVFDDGRLTDRSGNTVDFRHCIIILTSNVGSTIPVGTGVGFTAKQGSFAPDSVHKAIAQTFRREFVNRIDRVVIFNPLRRGVMRDILHKELNGLLQRRGFRSKDWAVEWAPSAVDFLLEKGFTPDLGARPLKRAIERYLLAPLAKTIVEHRFPEGNQFLFVSSDGVTIQVQFIDPDVSTPDSIASVAVEARPVRLKGIAYAPQGRGAELICLTEQWDALATSLGDDAWLAEKEHTQARMNDEGFLHAPDRYRILEAIEVMDRIEAGVEAAGGLLRRLRGHADLTGHTESLRRLAQQLILLELATRDVQRQVPQNALIHIVGLPAPELPREATLDVFMHIRKMYQQWAENRRMRSMWLRQGRLEDMQAVLAVTGLASWSILSAEQGLHVFELPREDGSFHLTRVRVRVSPQPVSLPSSNQSMLSYATDLFSQDDASFNTICRHYRWAPTPLVRDHIAIWESDDIARILGGDFDLFESD